MPKKKTSDPKANAVPLSTDERTARFEKLDKEQTGKLSRESYLASQSNPKLAAERFDKWDTNKDGFLTREEFIKKVSLGRPEAT